MVLVPLSWGTCDAARCARGSGDPVVHRMVRRFMVLGVKLVIVTLVAFSLLAGCSEQRLSCDDSSVTSRVAEILKGRAVAEFSSHCLGGRWPESPSVKSACSVSSGKAGEACREACRAFYEDNSEVTLSSVTARFKDSTTDALSCQADARIDLGTREVAPIEATVPYLAQPGPDGPRVVLVRP
jgi:hypothetical protein